MLLLFKRKYNTLLILIDIWDHGGAITNVKNILWAILGIFLLTMGIWLTVWFNLFLIWQPILLLGFGAYCIFKSHIISFVWDTTQRKNKEKIENRTEELEKSRKEYKQLINGMNDTTWVINFDGKFVEINNAAVNNLGYSREEFLSMGPKDIDPNLKPEEIKNLIDNIQEDELQVFETIHKTKDGKKIPVEISSTIITYQGETTILSVARDITKRKEGELKLKNAHKDLQELNETLEQKVKDRTERIQQLLKQKDAFINQLGHDLKNPLGPLLNLLPILDKHTANPKDKEILQVIQRNVVYMRDLVQKTIELAKLNSPDTEFSIEETNLFEEANGAIEKNILLFSEKNIEIINNISENIGVLADKLRLEELFDNLLSNASKYNLETGNIVLDAHEDRGIVTVSVKDSGIGMTKKQISAIFEEFYKADSSRHDFESSGLGMSICKRIVEKHGGNIWVESPGLNKGSTFYFTIPSA